jgi:hypothetical protein
MQIEFSPQTVLILARDMCDSEMNEWMNEWMNGYLLNE